MVASPLLSRLSAIGATVRRSATDHAADQAGRAYVAPLDRYTMLRAYYDNTAYEKVPSWAGYRAAYALPRQMRALYNPTNRAVGWYPGHVYPNTGDSPNAVPWQDRVDPVVRDAAETALTWANWRADRQVYVRTMGMLGVVFGEVDVDYERRKVYPRLYPPEQVIDIAEDASGNVTRYRLSVPTWDEERKRSYRWGKLVTKTAITTYYDDDEHGYDDQPATIPNPWGFVPGVWVQHRNVGGLHGAPVIDGVISKIDEANGMATAAADYIAKFTTQGVVFKTERALKEIVSFTPGAATVNVNAEADDGRADRQSMRYIKGPGDLGIDYLIRNLGLGEAKSYLVELLAEIENDLPETTMDKQLRSITGGITGPGARRMMADVANKLDEVQGNANAGLVKLMQMSVAIGGEMARSGQWGPRSSLTDAQRTLLPFGLDSYDRGDLVMPLDHPPLVAETEMERVMVAGAKEALKTPQALREAGYTADELYGEGVEPPTIGIIAERQNANTNLGDLFGQAFSAGTGA